MSYLIGNPTEGSLPTTSTGEITVGQKPASGANFDPGKNPAGGNDPNDITAALRLAAAAAQAAPFSAANPAPIRILPGGAGKVFSVGVPISPILLPASVNLKGPGKGGADLTLGQDLVTPITTPATTLPYTNASGGTQAVLVAGGDAAGSVATSGNTHSTYTPPAANFGSLFPGAPQTNLDVLNPTGRLWYLMVAGGTGFSITSDSFTTCRTLVAWQVGTTGIYLFRGCDTVRMSYTTKPTFTNGNAGVYITGNTDTVTPTYPTVAPYMDAEYPIFQFVTDPLTHPYIERLFIDKNGHNFASLFDFTSNPSGHGSTPGPAGACYAETGKHFTMDSVQSSGIGSGFAICGDLLCDGMEGGKMVECQTTSIVWRVPLGSLQMDGCVFSCAELCAQQIVHLGPVTYLVNQSITDHNTQGQNMAFGGVNFPIQANLKGVYYNSGGPFVYDLRVSTSFPLYVRWDGAFVNVSAGVTSIIVGNGSSSGASLTVILEGGTMLKGPAGCALNDAASGACVVSYNTQLQGAKPYFVGGAMTDANLLANTVAQGPGTPIFSTGLSAAASTTTTPGTMAGLGAAQFTPRKSTSVRATITVGIALAIAVQQGTFQPRWGTGASPTNQAANSGTAIGVAATERPSAIGLAQSVTLVVIITGLVLGTAIWVDGSYFTASGSDAITLANCQVTIEECPLPV
jgi:hypothetical protein